MEQDFRATQFVGSQADAEVLLEQPRAEIVLKQLRRRGRRQDNEYLIRFEGYPDSDSTWVTEQALRREPNGAQLIAEYEAAIEQEHADVQANSSDEDMTASVDIQGNAPQPQLAVPSAQDIVNQLWTQAPSEPQLPETQLPSQAAAAPVLARTAPATQEPEPAWEDWQRNRSEQIEAAKVAYRREVQASHGRPAGLRPAQRSSVLNGLPTSLWENSPLVNRRAQRAPIAGLAEQRAPVPQPGSDQYARPAQPGPAGPSSTADAWGFDVPDEPSQEDLAAADWARQHAAPQRPANPMVSARQNQPVGPEQIGYMAADPFGWQSPRAAAQPAWPPLQQGRPAAAGGGSPEQARLVPASFNRNRNSHWIGPGGGAHAQPLWAAAPRSATGPVPRHDFAAARHSPQPAAWAHHAHPPASFEPPADPQRHSVAGHSVGKVPAHAARMQGPSAAEPSMQPLGPLPAEAQQTRAARPLHADHAALGLPAVAAGQAAPAAAASLQRQEPAPASWYDSIAQQLLPSSRQPPQAAPARAAEQPPPRYEAAARAEPSVPAFVRESADADGLPSPRQWPAPTHPAPPQRLQSPLRPAQPVVPAPSHGAAARAPAAVHQGLFSELGRRAAEMIRQAPPAPEGPASGAAEGRPQSAPVREATWGAWATHLQALGGTVAAYAAAQVLPPELAAQTGGLPSTPVVDLNARPLAQAQPEGDEEPIEDFIDVPSLPSHDAEEDTRDREAGEKSRGRSQFKRLKRLYQPETEEEDPAPEEDAPELVPDSSEEIGAPAHRRRPEGGARVSPKRQRRQSHVIEDDEDEAQEASEMAEPGDNVQQYQEDGAPMDQIDEEDSVEDAYGLTQNELWHLQPQQWDDAVINRARHEENDVLLLRIHWPDDFSAWVNRYALHVRPHCHMKLIDFYESKAKPRR